MSVENGTAILLKLRVHNVGTLKPVDGTTSNSADISRALRDTTTKFTGTFNAREYGLGDAGFSLEAKFDADANTSTYFTYNDILAALIAGDKLDAEWSDGVTGHKKITGTVCIENCPMAAPMHDNATFSVSLKFDGAPTVATI
jgi:predicted secreted protein